MNARDPLPPSLAADGSGRAQPSEAAPAGASADPHDLTRFVLAQRLTHERALAEIRAGRKQSHWMWYIFPQIAGLGFSAMSKKYAIQSMAEAEAYLRHPELGPRLAACCEAAFALEGRSAREVFGSPDDMKLRSCATLFAAVSPPGSVFERLLAKYFAGAPDEKTISLLEKTTSLLAKAPQAK